MIEYVTIWTFQLLSKKKPIIAPIVFVYHQLWFPSANHSLAKYLRSKALYRDYEWFTQAVYEDRPIDSYYGYTECLHCCIYKLQSGALRGAISKERYVKK